MSAYDSALNISYAASALISAVALLYFFSVKSSGDNPKIGKTRESKLDEILGIVNNFKIEDNSDSYLKLMSKLSEPLDTMTEETGYEKILRKISKGEERAKGVFKQLKKSVDEISEDISVRNTEVKFPKIVIYAVMFFLAVLFFNLVRLSIKGLQ